MHWGNPANRAIRQGSETRNGWFILHMVSQLSFLQSCVLMIAHLVKRFWETVDVVIQWHRTHPCHAYAKKSRF